MSLFGSAKKESDQSVPTIPGGVPKPSSPADLLTVAERLSQLGHLLGEINEQFMVHLLRREAAESSSPKSVASSDETASGSNAVLQVIREKLESLEQKIVSAPRPSPGTIDESLKALVLFLRQKFEAVEHRDGELAQGLQKVHQAVDARLREIDGRLQETLVTRLAEVVQSLSPPVPEPEPIRTSKGSGDNDAWQRALLGSELTADPRLDALRSDLCRQILDGEPAACALIGQLLVFQGSSAEKMPQLLKDIGEAYYRWQPKSHAGPTPMETALKRWLESRCEAAGVPNTIELVSPAERFDVMRHNAATRGVEVTAVHGWIVLRDNGKVYTKATVTVR